tara:strand:- start:57 stop:185 length:129 start_codon:yes stop_codon:yes gene_type:complete
MEEKMDKNFINTFIYWFGLIWFFGMLGGSMAISWVLFFKYLV